MHQRPNQNLCPNQNEPQQPTRKPLVAREVTLEAIRRLAVLMPSLRRHDCDLANQIKRAMNSVLLNIDEGRKYFDGEQRRFFQRACASASEVRGGIEAAQTWGWSAELGDLPQILDRLVGLLWGLSRSSSTATATAKPRSRSR